TERGVPPVERGRDAGMIRVVKIGDSAPHLGRRELARVHGHAAVREAPHQSDAELGLARRRDRLGPRIGEQFGIDVRAVTVGVDVGAWKSASISVAPTAGAAAYSASTCVSSAWRTISRGGR